MDQNGKSICGGKSISRDFKWWILSFLFIKFIWNSNFYNFSSNSAFVSSTLHNSFTLTVVFPDGQFSSPFLTLFSSTFYLTTFTKRRTRHDRIKRKQLNVYWKSKKNMRMARTSVTVSLTEIVIKLRTWWYNKLTARIKMERKYNKHAFFLSLY